MFIILTQGGFMCGKVKYAVIYEMKHSSKYNKYYYHPCDIVVGYSDGDNFVCEDKKYKIFPQSINDEYTVCVYDIEPLIAKNPNKKLDDLLSNLLLEKYSNFYQLYVSDEIGEIMLKKVKNKNVIEACNKMFFEDIFNDKKDKNDLQAMYNDLCGTIIGQDNVLKGVFAHIVANHRLNNSDLPKDKISKMKSNIFINGETGTGKTFIVDEITKRLGIKYIKVDANDFTAAGYVGEDVNSIIYDLYDACKENLEQAETGIVVIDEIDKLACPDNNATVTTKAVQSALLTLMEGKKIVINRKKGENVVFDTSRLTFVVMGACAGIEQIAAKRISPSTLGFGNDSNRSTDTEKIIYETEDYITYGFMPEFMGRFSALYQTNKLDTYSLMRIMKDSKLSPYLLQKEFFAALGYNFVLSDEQLMDIAIEAEKSKNGARGIKKAIDKLCEEVLFSAVINLSSSKECDNNNKQLVINKCKNYQN